MCLADMEQEIFIRLSSRTIDLIERFEQIQFQKGLVFENADELIYYALHLAMTHIHITDLETELKQLEQSKKITSNEKKEDKLK